MAVKKIGLIFVFLGCLTLTIEIVRADGLISAAQLDSSSDYLVYYSFFDAQKVMQSQYYDLVILDIRNVTPEQVIDIRNGFDNVSGTDDDVLVLGYLSIGEQDGSTIQGDGSGPVYWDGESIVHQNNGYASFYLDDKDKNGIPDKDGLWNSYYVNAGDSAWWEYNDPQAEDIIHVYHCDGLFLDLVDTSGPNSWGLPYEWTSQGMIEYIEYLRARFPDKYLLANRGLFYLEPALPHFQYVDRYRQSIDGLMIESYYIIWDWNKSIGIYHTSFPYLSEHFAPLINQQAKQSDGFTVFILDYLKLNQSGYHDLLGEAVNAVERDQGWILTISTIYLDSIRWDVYHNHLVDNNSPTWADQVGLLKCNWLGDDLVVYWNTAIDQTPPLHYHLYLSEDEIDFSAPPQFYDLVSMDSDVSDYRYVINGLDKTKTYQLALRASDSAVPEHTDRNRNVFVVDSLYSGAVIIDGYFDDWGTSHQADVSGAGIESEGDNTTSKSCDIVDGWVQDNEEFYYFSFSTAGPMDISKYFNHVLIDEDNDSSSGFHFSGSYNGIDIMYENGYLHRYSGSDGEWSWQYLGTVDHKIGIEDPNRMELAIPKSRFTEMPTYISFLFHIDDADVQSADDFAPNNYRESAYYFPNPPSSITESKQVVMDELQLTHRAYPNPFNSSITFSGQFNRSVPGDILIKVYDLSGCLIHRRIIVKTGESDFRYCWTVSGPDIKNLSSGIYLFQIIEKENRKIADGKILFMQ